MRTSSRRHTGHIPSKRCRFRIERDLGRRSLQTWFFRIHTQARLPPSRPQGLRLVQTGGASRDRTDDLMLAKQPLSQLSYGPNRECGQIVGANGGPGTTRTSDLTLIRGAL